MSRLPQSCRRAEEMPNCPACKSNDMVYESQSTGTILPKTYAVFRCERDACRQRVVSEYGATHFNQRHFVAEFQKKKETESHGRNT